MPDILSLSLDHGQHQENLLYRIHRDDVLRISPGPSLLGKKLQLFTNYPVEGKDFDRNAFQLLKWKNAQGQPLTPPPANDLTFVKDLDIYCELVAERAGSFKFYITYAKGGAHEASFYVQIEPKIFVGPPKAKKLIPLDSVRCQTVLAKCLGPINTWEAKLKVAKESGFNAVHFTPVQELGASRSCYSLANQLKVSTTIYFPILDREVKMK